MYIKKLHIVDILWSGMPLKTTQKIDNIGQETITEPEKDRCQKMPVFKASFLVFLVPHSMEGG